MIKGGIQTTDWKSGVSSISSLRRMIKVSNNTFNKSNQRWCDIKDKKQTVVHSLH